MSSLLGMPGSTLPPNLKDLIRSAEQLKQEHKGL